jgi:hypothetical protein
VLELGQQSSLLLGRGVSHFVRSGKKMRLIALLRLLYNVLTAFLIDHFK